MTGVATTTTPSPLPQGIAGGNAPAAEPVAGHTITTTATGLQTSWTSIASGDGAMLPVYVARPPGRGPFPIILVIHEIFGVHEHIADIARRLAHLGYCACAPQLFNRLGDPMRATDIEAIQRDFAAKTADLQVLNDIDNAIDLATTQGGDLGRLGVTGFCWGGRIAWLYAAHNPEVHATVAWYGRLVGPISDLTPQQPITIAPSLHTPVLGLYGGKDPSIPPATIAAQRKALQSAKEPCEIIEYPDASHAFFADYRASFHPESAADAWYRMLSWFQQHGVR
jgi:carboxymethylenebutenolidase